MKKLLVLAATIVAGVAVNAASFKWTASNMYAADQTTKYAGTVSLYAYLSTADISTVTLVDTFTPTTAGTINNTFSDTSLTAGNTYSFFFTVEETYNGKDWIYTSKSVNVMAPETTTATVAFGTQATTSRSTVTTAGGNGWYAVPEPTSGLLMLLGMAGLALRRRRA